MGKKHEAEPDHLEFLRGHIRVTLRDLDRVREALIRLESAVADRKFRKAAVAYADAKDMFMYAELNMDALPRQIANTATAKHHKDKKKRKEGGKCKELF